MQVSALGTHLLIEKKQHPEFLQMQRHFTTNLAVVMTAIYRSKLQNVLNAAAVAVKNQVQY